MTARITFPVFFIALSQATVLTAGYHVISHCEQIDSIPKATCDIRLSEPAEIERISVTGKDGKKERIISASPFPASMASTATLILVDRKRRIGQQTMRVIREEIDSIFVSSANDNRMIGLASFTNELMLHAPVGSSRSTLTNALNSIRADSAASGIYRSAISAISYLETLSASRKHLIIISDGVDRDTSNGHSDIISKARASQISVHGLGFIERASRTSELQGLRSIALETNGIFVQADLSDKRLPLEFSKQYFDTIESGAVINISTENQNETQQFILSLWLAKEEPIEAKIDVALTNIENPLLFERVLKIAEKFMTELAILFGLAVVGASALLLYGIRKNDAPAIARPEKYDNSTKSSGVPVRDRTVEDLSISGDSLMKDSGPTLSDSEPDLALPTRFVRIDTADQIWNITKDKTQVGRAKECDICIVDPTVHRQHALLVKMPEGNFLITDISGLDGNGIYVNDERIIQKELCSGDLVEFGAVHLRFIMEISNTTSEPDNLDLDPRKSITLSPAELSISKATEPELTAH